MSTPPDPFQAIVATLDYPMFVVTTANTKERSGCLVGFLTQGSIEPRRLVVCISKANHTARVVRGARSLAVHILREDQLELARRFGETSGDEIDKFAQVDWHEGPDGVPLLDGCDWMAGRILERLDLGDHEGNLVHITQAGHDHPGGRQLGFQAVKGLDPGHDA